MQVPKVVALGANGSFYILSPDGEEVWDGIPTWLHNKINGRNNAGHAPVSYLALGKESDDDAFVQFEDNKCYWRGLEDFNVQGEVRKLSFGPDGAWFSAEKGLGYDWYGLPDSLVRRLRGRQSWLPGLRRVEMDEDGGYWAQFADGSAWFGELDDDLRSILHENTVKDVVLGPDGTYFVKSANGRMFWRVSNSFTNSIHRHRHLDPSEIRYTQRSISRYFSDEDYGTIYDLEDTLRWGQLDEDDVDPIRVVWHEDVWWSLDNRRLWAFKEADSDKILVQVVEANGEFYRKRNSVTDGWSVQIRGS
ncbi:hypothetical protein HK104_002657 [Borealophlyctis nickersoniae]|nr:hypothetical protein HK104_002657 [Borealophlyctis nickersoniae]